MKIYRIILFFICTVTSIDLFSGPEVSKFVSGMCQFFVETAITRKVLLSQQIDFAYCNQLNDVFTAIHYLELCDKINPKAYTTSRKQHAPSRRKNKHYMKKPTRNSGL